MEILTDFKREMQQAKLHARHLVQVEVPVHPLLLNITSAIYMGTKMNYYKQKRKTLPQDYHRHLCVPSPSNRRRSIVTHQ